MFEKPNTRPEVSEGSLLDLAHRKAGLFAAYLRDSFEQDVCDKETFLQDARWVLKDVEMESSWFDTDMSAPEWKTHVDSIASSVMRLQMACYPREEWEQRCDGLFGPSSWAALKKKAGERSAVATAGIQESALREELSTPRQVDDSIEGFEWKAALPYEWSHITPQPRLPEKAPKANYVVFGDSLFTSRGGVSQFAGCDYFGKEGLSTNAMIKKMDTLSANDFRDVVGGRDVLIALGGNNISGGISTEKSISDLDEIARRVEHAGGRVRIAVRMPYPPGDPRVTAHHALREAIYEYFEGTFPICDFAEGFGVKDAEGRWVLRNEFKTDKTGTHFVAGTYQQMAGASNDWMQKIAEQEALA